MMTCIIIEDEPLARLRLREYISRTDTLLLTNEFSNAEDALEFLRKETIDLIFLDIRMDGMSGLTLLETHSIKAPVILTTAYPEFAWKGFDLNVTDYLLKPYDYNRFIQAVHKAQKELDRKPGTWNLGFLMIRTEYRLERILFSNLLFIEGMRDYRRVHTTDRNIMTLQTFKEFEREVPSRILCRVHKSYMACLDKIEAVERSEILIGRHRIPISDTYRESFMKLLQSK